MPIAMVEEDATVQVVTVTGDDSVRQHLSELGFVPGTEVTVLSKTGEDMIVKVKEARVALNAKMARRIMVAE